VRKKRFVTAYAVLAVVALAVFSAGAQDKNREVRFQGRTIDLKPHIEGFPYSGFTPWYDAGRLFYYHTGETTTLRQIVFSGGDLREGEIISDVDFSTRNVWGIRYRKSDGLLYWSGDERNDEVINLYSLDTSTREIRKLTDVPYIFGWRWDHHQERAAYVARLGDKENRLGELRILDLESQRETTVTQDSPDFRFTWSTPSWGPGGDGVVVAMLRDADRNQANIAWVDLETGQLDILTNPDKKRIWPQILREWPGPRDFLYVSNEDGFSNVYRCNLDDRRSVQVTRFDRDVGEAELLTIDGKKYLFVVLSNPIESEFVLVDPETKEIVRRQKVDVNVSILDTNNNRMLVSCTSGTVKFRIDELTVTTDEFALDRKITVPRDLESKILHADVERVQFPTFDTDPATGRARMLHAFLYKPKNPLPAGQRIVMIQSFYGGSNRWSTRTQILAEAGIYVLSPSPRGSRGFGREFAALNDRDLGGNEIIDIIYAGKYVSEKLGVPPSRIGVYGGSHGGYATMRLLTFPGEVNGNRAQFDWGFGISHAGFSDIDQFYRFCNIPDWVLLEAGDPETEADKLRDRSPLYHADQMQGKLLLTHGTNDSRVPIEGSRWMADSLRTYGKDVTLVEFEGQGHGIKGLDNSITFYNVWFEFLENLEN
jgi:dipeptidyl aminopeptidase/acylaminoacyl peptidase